MLVQCPGLRNLVNLKDENIKHTQKHNSFSIYLIRVCLFVFCLLFLFCFVCLVGFFDNKSIMYGRVTNIREQSTSSQ